MNRIHLAIGRKLAGRLADCLELRELVRLS